MSSLDATRVDYRRLMKKVEQVAGAIDRLDDSCATVHTLTDKVLHGFHAELGLRGGRLYRRDGDRYVLDSTFGDAPKVVETVEVPLSYAPLAKVLSEHTVAMKPQDPSIDPALEGRLGAGEFVALEVGDGEYVLAFDIEPGADHGDILFSLGILRHAINQKLRQERMAGILLEASKIQRSILPKRSPSYGEFDICGLSEPLETVGGDYFDYIPISNKILGLAIADVSGHGLPAALQVRDIYMGLRMGLARDYKIVRTVERLNGIIHQSTLTSRFVSMFYGELELGGTFIYVNAGHPRPFHLAASGAVRFLSEGGPVLGPLPETRYERGFVVLEPGDLLVFFTDGITETVCADGDCVDDGEDEEFGSDRLVELCRSLRQSSAQEIAEAVLREVKQFSGRRPVNDDRTVVVVRRPPLSAS
ncbi:MAG: PP2C family protein-serine/threonine phosphatase [Acidobacteriota bacterium]